LAFTYCTGRSTVSGIVEEVCEAIWKNLLLIVMPEPNEEIWRASENVFKEKWNFPHCVAAIDGKQVRIEAPPHRGSEFFNYKKYHSVVLLALVDANKRFLTLDVGQYGRVSDGNVFANSNIAMRLARQNIGLPPDENLGGVPLPYIVIGGEAFPLKRYLMRPYPRSARRLGEAQRIFNYRLSRSRNTVENAFGILANTMRIYRRPFECRVQLRDELILATDVLHNYILESPTETNRALGEEQTNPLVRKNVAAATNSTREALDVRISSMEYFMSDEGSVEWQKRVVNRVN